MEVYQPREDSQLLLAAAIAACASRKPKTVLEIGSGSGFVVGGLARTAKEIGMDIRAFATDINRAAARQTAKLGSRAVLADLFAGLRGRFDMILFNPPYLPRSEHDRNLGASKAALVDDGAIAWFIAQLPRHLAQDGACLLLTSSLSAIDVERAAKRSHLACIIVRQKRLFFEQLSVWQLSVSRTTA